MKKLFIAVLAFLALAVTCIYIFIPSKIKISNAVFISCNANSTARFLLDKNNWEHWFPGQPQQDSNIFKSQNFIYSVTRASNNGVEVSISKKDLHLTSSIIMVPISNNNIGIQWQSEMPENSGPIKRLFSYSKASKLHRNMDLILDSLKTFLEKKDNLYDVQIKEIKVMDTLLVATRFTSNSLPSTEDIYGEIKNLRNYILTNGSKPSNFPMLHVSKDGSKFKVMVALPIHKIVPQTATYSIERMVPGNILVTEVSGGKSIIDKGRKQIENFISDNQRTLIALPFDALVTNRMQQPDTTKWITKIYYPVM